MINYKKLFYLRCKGYNMREIADELKVHIVTVQRYFSKFKKMSDEEFKGLLEY